MTDDGTDAVTDSWENGKEKVAEAANIGLPAASFKWFQPLAAETYTGQRRYGGGDSVQAYSLNTATDDEDVTTWVTTK